MEKLEVKTPFDLRRHTAHDMTDNIEILLRICAKLKSLSYIQHPTQPIHHNNWQTKEMVLGWTQELVRLHKNSLEELHIEASLRGHGMPNMHPNTWLVKLQKLKKLTINWSALFIAQNIRFHPTPRYILVQNLPKSIEELTLVEETLASATWPHGYLEQIDTVVINAITELAEQNGPKDTEEPEDRNWPNLKKIDLSRARLTTCKFSIKIMFAVAFILVSCYLSSS